MQLATIIVDITVAAVALGCYWVFVRPRHLRWGATDEEIRVTLPGDEFVPPQPHLNMTHAITVHAPISEVWPWLAQIGQNKGGFYSYAWLENLFGARIRNAERIVPEWQHPKVGDSVWLHPKKAPVPITALEPGHALVLGAPIPPHLGSWAFVLRPINEQATRFIVRSRMNYNPDFNNAILNFLAWRVVVEPASFIMERKMMLTIKQRAETAVRQR